MTNILQKQYYRSSLHTKKFIYRVKGVCVCVCVCVYVLRAALNFTLSFLRIVTMGGKMLKIFMPAKNVLF